MRAPSGIARPIFGLPSNGNRYMIAAMEKNPSPVAARASMQAMPLTALMGLVANYDRLLASYGDQPEYAYAVAWWREARAIAEDVVMERSRVPVEPFELHLDGCAESLRGL